jgi:hypothetical protein
MNVMSPLQFKDVSQVFSNLVIWLLTVVFPEVLDFHVVYCNLFF